MTPLRVVFCPRHDLVQDFAPKCVVLECERGRAGTNLPLETEAVYTPPWHLLRSNLHGIQLSTLLLHTERCVRLWFHSVRSCHWYRTALALLQRLPLRHAGTADRGSPCSTAQYSTSTIVQAFTIVSLLSQRHCYTSLFGTASACVSSYVLCRCVAYFLCHVSSSCLFILMVPGMTWKFSFTMVVVN